MFVRKAAGTCRSRRGCRKYVALRLMGEADPLLHLVRKAFPRFTPVLYPAAPLRTALRSERHANLDGGTAHRLRRNRNGPVDQGHSLWHAHQAETGAIACRFQLETHSCIARPETYLFRSSAQFDSKYRVWLCFTAFCSASCKTRNRQSEISRDKLRGMPQGRAWAPAPTTGTCSGPRAHRCGHARVPPRDNIKPSTDRLSGADGSSRCAGLLLPSLSVYSHHDEPQLQRYFPEC